MVKEYIRASELAQYIYCECCWLDELEGKGEVTTAMMVGTAEHESVSFWYRYLAKSKQLAIIIILIGLLILGISFIISNINF